MIFEKTRIKIGNNIKKRGILNFARDILFGKPNRTEIAGHKKELLMGWINNDLRYYVLDDDILGLGNTNEFSVVYEIYRRMMIKWPHYRHTIRKRQNLTLSHKLIINPGGDEGIDNEIAQFCRDVIFAIPELKEDLRELLDCIQFGFSVSEIIWGIKDNKWIIKELKNRNQERFRFRIDGRWGLDKEGTRTDFEPVDWNKFVIMQYNKEYEKPYGQGEGRNNYWYYFFQQNALKFWLTFLDKFGAPTAVGKYARYAQPEEKEALLQALEALQNDQVVRIPEDTMIDLLEAQRQGSIDCYDSFVKYLETSVSKNILGSTLSSDEGRYGTRAQAETHYLSMCDYVYSDCALLAGVLRDQLISRLVRYNFGDSANIPTVEFQKEENENLLETAKTYEILITKIGLPVDNKDLYDKFGIPEPEEKDQEEQERGKEQEEEKEAEQEAEKEAEQEKKEEAEVEEEEMREEEKQIIGFQREDVKIESDIIEDITGEEKEELRKIGERWGLDEERYINNAVSDGKQFYFNVMDLIREGVETAEDTSQVYGLSVDALGAESETRVNELSSYLTRMMYTAWLNGYSEIYKMALGKGIKFSFWGGVQSLFWKNKIFGVRLGAQEFRGQTRAVRTAAVSDPDRKVIDQTRDTRERAAVSDPVGEFQEGIEYQSIPLLPEEAIEYFEELVPLTRAEFENQLLETRKYAFTVSDIQRKDVLGKIQDRLTESIRKGETFRDWQKSMAGIFKNEGVSPFNNFRMRTIFETNIHRAMIQGRDRAANELVMRGIIKKGIWQTVGDDRVRDEHAEKDGQIYNWNDPVWSFLLDYRCRCNKIPVLR